MPHTKEQRVETETQTDRVEETRVEESTTEKPAPPDDGGDDDGEPEKQDES